MLAAFEAHFVAASQVKSC